MSGLAYHSSSAGLRFVAALATQPRQANSFFTQRCHGMYICGAHRRQEACCQPNRDDSRNCGCKRERVSRLQPIEHRSKFPDPVGHDGLGRARWIAIQIHNCLVLYQRHRTDQSTLFHSRSSLFRRSIIASTRPSLSRWNSRRPSAPGRKNRSTHSAIS